MQCGEYHISYNNYTTFAKVSHAVFDSGANHGLKNFFTCAFPIPAAVLSSTNKSYTITMHATQFFKVAKIS